MKSKKYTMLKFLSELKIHQSIYYKSNNQDSSTRQEKGIYFRGLGATFDSTKLLIEGAFSLTIPKSTIQFFELCVYQFQLPNFFNIYLYAYQIFFTL